MHADGDSLRPGASADAHQDHARAAQGGLGRASAAGLDHLKHLGPGADQAPLAIQQSQDGAGGSLGITAFGGTAGGEIPAQGILLELVAPYVDRSGMRA